MKSDTAPVRLFVRTKYACDLCERLYRSYLIVRPRHGYENRLRFEKSLHLFWRHDAMLVRIRIRNIAALPFDISKTAKYGIVFDGARYPMRALECPANALQPAGIPENGEVIRFGKSGREYELARFRA